MSCSTGGYTAVYAYFAHTRDEKVMEFWGWIIIPISITAMGISFFLKPRREDRAYKVALIFQYVLFAFVSEFLAVVGYDFAMFQIIASSARSLCWLALLKFGLKCRSHVARLSDEDLSKFLTNDVIFGGMLVGLGQLAFLMFASIQCDGNNNTDDWRQCRRTLYSQGGLSFLVALFTIIKLASGVVPKRILDKHVISPKKVAAMDLNAEEAVQFFGLAIAAGCALWPLGNYGAEGDFGNNADGKVEMYAAFIVPSIGGFCLLLTAVWKAVVIRGQIRREAEETGRLHQGQFISENSALVEDSSFWFCIGVLTTNYESSIIIATAVTMDESYKTLAIVSLPIAILMYLGSLFCQPRRKSPKDMWKLRLHFMSFSFIAEMAWAVHGSRQGDFGYVILHFALLAAQTLLFHFGLKLRAAVGRLPDKDLEAFLVDTLFKGGLKTLFSILFLAFRTTKCVFEKGSAECSKTSICSTTISVYLLGWWVTKIVQGSVRSEWKDLKFSIEKIARMRDISLRRGLAGFLTLVAGICAIFLFSMLSADDMDDTTIAVVGLTGGAAVLGVVVSEIYSSLKAQTLRGGQDRDRETHADLVETMIKNRGGALMEDQALVFKRCEELFEDGCGEDLEGRGWERLKCEDLTAWSKCAPMKEGENSTAVGKAMGTVDSSAEEAAAFVMSFCDSEKMRISRAAGHPARLVLTEEDGYPLKDNEITVATVKRMPSFLNNREFVTRMIWKSEEGKVVIAIESIDDNVDDAYGRKLRKTRGFTRALWEIVNFPQRGEEGEGEDQQQCKITMVQRLDAGGSIPAWVTNRKMPIALSAVQEAIIRFRRGMNAATEQKTEVEGPIEECAWFFVCVNFLFTSTLPVLIICYGATLNILCMLMVALIFPITALSFSMAVFYKPKRTDAGYKRFLYFHFFTFAVVSESALGIGSIFRRGLTFMGLFTLFRIPFWCLAFRLGLKFRESAAKLPPQELSDFLCQTVLVKGTAAIGPMLFLSFEAISCFISQDSLDNGQCSNTLIASMLLSTYLAILTILSIASKAVPKSVQREAAWDLSSIASLKGLKWWQQIQGGLIIITAIASLYLLSILGVEANGNSMVFKVGALGGVSLAFAALINATMLSRTINEQQQNTTTVELPPIQRSVQGFSARDIEKNALALALV
ncbi:hypothetical protein TrVE_jg9990 [Triparma verrucosa]|uniref:Uncharacterized protein n=1 Tax=Triparma verrucosa TaxID=1606542 RepID=A0A9W7BXQ7_9STRA|nr:hypothetical protein TrVE_jg9990 [Triparma verrucosa]